MTQDNAIEGLEEARFEVAVILAKHCDCEDGTCFVCKVLCAARRYAALQSTAASDDKGEVDKANQKAYTRTELEFSSLYESHENLIKKVQELEAATPPPATPDNDVKPLSPSQREALEIEIERAEMVGHLRTPAEPSITIRELRKLVEGMKMIVPAAPWIGEPYQDEAYRKIERSSMHNAALDSLLEAAGNGGV